MGLLILIAAGTGKWIDGRASVRPSASAASIVLLPASISGYRVERGWSHFVFGGSVREEGALYSPATEGAAADPILLDFFRNARGPHNGAGCYLLQGEKLRKEVLQVVDTRSGPIQFDIVTTEAESHLRLTAATECRSDGCTETLVRRVGWAPWQHWALRNVPSADAKAVVPFSVVIERDRIPDMRQSAAIEAQLQEEFSAIAAQLDLAPAQRLAAALN